MAKKTPTTIVEVWNKKLVPKVESGELTAIEQLTLFYLAISLNRNFWEPAKVNAAMIAAAMNKDKRTIQKAIRHLIELKIVFETEEGEITFEQGYRTVSRIEDRASTVQDANNDGTASGGESDSEESKSAGRGRRLFNAK